MQYLSKGKQGKRQLYTGWQRDREGRFITSVSSCDYKPVYSAPREPINHGELAVSTAANQII